MAKLTELEHTQHAAVLQTTQHNLQLVVEAVETLNAQANYDSLLEALDSAQQELATKLHKLV